MKSRKGSDSFEFMSKIYQLIFLTVIVITVIFVVRSFVINKIDVKEAESTLLIERLISSKECLAYYDLAIDRTYPGIIDLGKLKTTNLDACIYYDYSKNKRAFVAAKLVLKTGTDYGKETVAFVNEDGHGMLAPIAGMSGPSGATSYTQNRFVLVKNLNGELEKGLLLINILKPND